MAASRKQCSKHSFTKSGSKRKFKKGINRRMRRLAKTDPGNAPQKIEYWGYT